MRLVFYRCYSDGYKCRTLSQLRSHVEFYNSANHRNDYDGDYVHRYYYCQGSWVLDEKFLRRIAVINGRVCFRNFSFCCGTVMP